MPGADAPCQSNTHPYRYRAHDAMLRRLLSRSRFDESTHRLYDTMVERARDPVFYAELGVPDTLDGRFEMNVLHGLLIMRRLREIEQGGTEAAQSLFDLMFADFDSALRQIGVGDLKVGSRIKKMGQAFYGRASTLDKALADGAEPGELKEVLRRNTFGTVEAEPGHLVVLETYVRSQIAHLDSQPDDALLAGNMTLVSPDPASTH